MMQTDDVNMSDKSTLESAHAHINVNSLFTNAQDNNVEIEDSDSESRMENISITNSDFGKTYQVYEYKEPFNYGIRIYDNTRKLLFMYNGKKRVQDARQKKQYQSNQIV